ncbi:MAG: helix-turn-helix transcriptional regulator [Oceanicaulis sp.]
MDWARQVREFRERVKLKQDALADLLLVSQSTVSRLESGTLTPAPALRARLERLFSRPENEPLFSRCRTLVAVSPAICFLLGLRDGAIVLEAASEPARRLGPPWSEQAVGAPLRGDLGADAPAHLKKLVELGVFRGEVSSVDVLWTQGAGEATERWHTVFVPVRDEAGDWFLHGTAVAIDAEEFARFERGWGGGLRLRGREPAQEVA